jgi:hypothetical protein
MFTWPFLYISSTACHLLWCCTDYLRWYYSPDTEIIMICEQVKDKKNVLYHELWHYVYFEKLNDKQRVIIDNKYTQEEWADIFAKWIKKDPTRYKKYFNN